MTGKSSADLSGRIVIPQDMFLIPVGH